MEEIHRYNDGSILYKTTIQVILEIPVWKGNRIMDREHAKKISMEIKDIKTLDSGYHTIVYNELDAVGNIIQQRYLIDGQHRAEVIRQSIHIQREITGVHIPTHFTATLKEKFVENESEAIEYFNRINNTKPIHYNEDPSLITNKIITALESQFNKMKGFPMIRQAKTKRPFLFIDDVRTALLPIAHTFTNAKITEFINHVIRWNTNMCNSYEVNTNNDSIAEKCYKIQFFLAYSHTFTWITEFLHE